MRGREGEGEGERERERGRGKRERGRGRGREFVFTEAHTAVCISERTNSDASVLCIDNKHQHDTTQGSNGS